MKKPNDFLSITDFVDWRIKKNIQNIVYIFIVLFIILFCRLTYLQKIKSDFLINHPLNTRSAMQNKKIMRGKIIDKNGNVLVKTIITKNGYKRIYIYGKVLSHVVGYQSSKYSNAGIEKTFDKYLSGSNFIQRRFGALAKLWNNNTGYDVQLTIDLDLQQTATKELDNHMGAIVVINPKTGEILAMVSAPTFNPEYIDRDWDIILKSNGSPLLNRTLLGLYPPGSIIKPITAEIALTEKICDKNRIFHCKGKLEIETNYILNEINNEIHGNINLTEALAKSCNTAFALLATEIGGERFAKGYNRYGFYQAVTELNECSSNIPNFKHINKEELAQIGIGQGDLLVTPLKMAMVASVFANNGVMMKPYLVSKVIFKNNIIFKEYYPEILFRSVKSDIAEQIKNMMVETVDMGTGRNSRIKNIKVAGKTGTAENSKKNDHAWFIGFAPADNPQIAIAIIVENAGWGSEIAAPIAKRIIEKALR